jgi:hypothetical protein
MSNVKVQISNEAQISNILGNKFEIKAFDIDLTLGF